MPVHGQVENGNIHRRMSHLLIRLFYKSTNPAFASLQTATEEELLKVALRDIELSLGISGTPVTSEVTNWSDMMPNYHIHHRKIVQAIGREARARLPRYSSSWLFLLRSRHSRLYRKW